MTEPALPSLDLVRQVTDQHVLDQLLGAAELTRAEIAARTGISKPTISESVRRLVGSGLIAESGRQVGKRGPAGTNYALRSDLGVALSVSAGPAGVVAQTHDLHGTVVHRAERAVSAPIAAARLAPVVTEAVTAVTADLGPVRGCAVSLAGPVDQSTGRLVRLAYAPFLVDALDLRTLLADLVAAPIQVDNDVNWAALAEHDQGSAVDLDDAFYCYLGAGIGAAVMINGTVVHGAGGLAGELAHVRTVGPGGTSCTLLECLAAWDLLLPSMAVDLGRLELILVGETAADRRRRAAVADAVAGAIGSVTALLNPQAVIMGGPWGTRHGFRALVADRLADAAIGAEIRAARLGDTAPLLGAQLHAVRAAQSSLARAR